MRRAKWLSPIRKVAINTPFELRPNGLRQPNESYLWS